MVKWFPTPFFFSSHPFLDFFLGARRSSSATGGPDLFAPSRHGSYMAPRVAAQVVQRAREPCATLEEKALGQQVTREWLGSSIPSAWNRGMLCNYLFGLFTKLVNKNPGKICLKSCFVGESNGSSIKQKNTSDSKPLTPKVGTKDLAIRAAPHHGKREFCTAFKGGGWAPKNWSLERMILSRIFSDSFNLEMTYLWV